MEQGPRRLCRRHVPCSGVQAPRQPAGSEASIIEEPYNKAMKQTEGGWWRRSVHGRPVITNVRLLS
jgi:hypothetical protein